MKLVLSRTRALLVGVALIVATNAVVLGGVAYNRSGTPDSTLQLTERELQIRTWSWPENENSSIDVDLRWRVPEIEQADRYGGSWYGTLPWLKAERLQELGFEVSGDLESDEVRERLRRQSSRRAWFVLEHDGPAYARQLDSVTRRVAREEALAQTNAGKEEFQYRLKAAHDDYRAEQHSQSRLFVIDSAPEEAGLRARYPDRRKYLIVPGSIDLAVTGEPGPRRLIGYIDQIDVSTIRVPHTYRALVEPFTERTVTADPREPRFEATVHFGRRFEPWIAALKLLQR